MALLEREKKNNPLSAGFREELGKSGEKERGRVRVEEYRPPLGILR